MNNPKRQHLIPKMLLRNFCDDSGYLWVGDKSTGKVWKCRPDNAFVVADLYTKISVEAETGGSTHKSYEYEEALGRIESEAAPVIREVIAQIRNKKVPEITPENETVLKRFLFSMARRTPESQRRLVSTKDFESIFHEVAKEHALAHGQPLPDQDTLSEDIRYVRLVKHTEHNVDARFAAGEDSRMHAEEERFCSETGLRFLLIDVPKRSFVIGSHGITIHKLGQDEAQSYFPISHNICVMATPFPDEATLFLLDYCGKQLIKAINRSTATQSQQIAGCSEALIRSFMRPRD